MIDNKTEDPTKYQKEPYRSLYINFPNSMQAKLIRLTIDVPEDHPLRFASISKTIRWIVTTYIENWYKEHPKGGQK